MSAPMYMILQISIHKALAGLDDNIGVLLCIVLVISIHKALAGLDDRALQ